MFFLMFFFESWVHGVSYRFHALKIPLLSFIIGSRIWMDNQASLLNMYCLSWLLPWIYTSSSSMDHRISSLLILASCMSAYNRLPPSNRVHASICILIVFCRVHASVLLSSTKRHKSFSNFLLIADFFLSLLLLSLFMIDSAYLAIAST
jgi:hypothetical protein